MSTQSLFVQTIVYLFSAISATLLHLFILLGPGLIMAFAMHHLSRQIAHRLIALIGYEPYLYLFSYVGTFFHELGHAVFCLIFGYRIVEFKFYEPDNYSPYRGHVLYLYNPKSFYHLIGQFFTGIGPIFVGTAVIALASYLLIGPVVINPITQMGINLDNLNSGSEITAFVQLAISNMGALFKLLLSRRALLSWQLYTLLYLIISVGSSITLSLSDLEGVIQGLSIIILLLLAFNISTLWMGNFANRFFLQISQLYQLFYGMMLFVLIINTLVFLLLLLTVTIRHRLK
ncbi:MAG: M50 family metallopeptidase [Anaerolineales bacterium]|nr:M50 family metallopeptidase [Anaerolineales bacterium]